MRNRDWFGQEKYNTPLQPHNGRNFLQDAYEESLDKAVYLRGLMVEMKDLGDELRALARGLPARPEELLLAIIKRYPVLG